MIRLLAVLALVSAAGGCAYGISHEAEVLMPERLARVRQVVVVPFRYPHRWTGFFRGIYKSAGLEPPPVEKVENVEATFLLEVELWERGYELKDMPKLDGLLGGEPGDFLDWEADMPEGKRRAALAKFQAAGAQAFLVAGGHSNCPAVYHCIAEVEIKLMDAEAGLVIWQSKARGETLIGQGNEMRAAVEEALAALPAPAR